MIFEQIKVDNIRLVFSKKTFFLINQKKRIQKIKGDFGAWRRDHLCFFLEELNFIKIQKLTEGKT